MGRFVSHSESFHPFKWNLIKYFIIETLSKNQNFQLSVMIIMSLRGCKLGTAYLQLVWGFDTVYGSVSSERN